MIMFGACLWSVASPGRAREDGGRIIIRMTSRVRS